MSYLHLKNELTNKQIQYIELNFLVVADIFLQKKSFPIRKIHEIQQIIAIDKYETNKKRMKCVIDYILKSTKPIKNCVESFELALEELNQPVLLEALRNEGRQVQLEQPTVLSPIPSTSTNIGLSVSTVTDVEILELKNELGLAKEKLMKTEEKLIVTQEKLNVAQEKIINLLESSKIKDERILELENQKSPIGPEIFERYLHEDEADGQHKK